MSSVSAHIIRRQILELRGVREADAAQLQEEIGKLFEEKILPLLDRYMSEHSPGDITHRIDLLELDIGTVYRNNLEEDFIKKLVRQLEIYFQPQPTFDSNFTAGKEEIPSEKSHLEIFSFFIETGNLPWWADFKDCDPVKESLDFLIQNERFALRQLMNKWVRQPAVIKRIVIQTGFPKWTELAAMNLDFTSEDLTSILSRLMDLLKKTTSWKNYSNHKLQEIIGLKFLPWIFLAPRKTQNTTDFWRDFLIQLTGGKSVEYDNLFAEFFRQFEKNNREQTAQKEQKRRGKQKEQEKTEDQESDLTENLDNQKILELAEEEILELVEKEQHQFSDTDELFVNNAGLVILFPFLHRFFENLNLLDDRRFINAAAAHRAVGLLQFLADGREIPLEHQCGLNKILCGLDAETVLEFGEPVTIEEAQICQNLLEAVIANAPILGEMSVQGFRGSFLMRKGILRAGAGVWYLNVERETFDVVMERFPWTWSIVKLPWMEWAISVEWV